MSLMSDSNQSKSKYGHMRRRLLAARMLMDYLMPMRRQIKPYLRHTPKDYSYEVYEPLKISSKAVMMIYGFTIAGEKEVRLVRLAKSFAAAGFRVIVPVLPGIKSINIEMGDLDILVDLMTTLCNESDNSIGIVGFSVGGGLALVAAADPGLNGFVDPIILLGPYYSLPELWSDLWRKDIYSPITDKQYNDFIWQQMVLAYRDHRELNFSKDELDELENLLQVYCFESSLSRKLEAYERLVKPRGLFDPRSVPMDINELERLSPCNKLGKLQSRVLIIHDPHDPLSPCEQSSQIIEELQKRGYPSRQRLLISSMFSHIDIQTSLKISDLVATFDIFGELFSEKASLP